MVVSPELVVAGAITLAKLITAALEFASSRSPKEKSLAF
jgi:hypothetical protein